MGKAARVVKKRSKTIPRADRRQKSAEVIARAALLGLTVLHLLTITDTTLERYTNYMMMFQDLMAHLHMCLPLFKPDLMVA